MRENGMWIRMGESKTRMMNSWIGLKNFFSRTKSNSFLALLQILIFISIGSGSPPYPCGFNEIRKKSYGAVEFRVNCRGRQEYNIVSALEYKGKIQHGVQLHYDSLWRKQDSCFMLSGKKEGEALFWDSLGNVIGRESYRKGKYIGFMEFYWEPGRPSLIKHYNAQGKE